MMILELLKNGSLSKKIILTGVVAAAALAGCRNGDLQYPVQKDIVETVYASGKIMADSEYTVYALSPGIITAKLVREGDLIRRGSLLYAIRNTGPAARSAAADEALNYARGNLAADSRVLNDLKIARRNADLRFLNDSVNYARYRNLWVQNIGTRSNLDNLQTQYELSLNERRSAREKYFATVNDLKLALRNAKSQSVNARADLDNYSIRAEGPGMVYQTLKESGEAVKANEAVALIGKANSRIMRLEVDQQDVDRIRIGQTVLLKTDVSGDRIYKAAVDRIYPVMNEADQTFRVDAVFTDTGLQSFIHSSVEANIVTSKKRNCLVIPVTYLLAGDSVITKASSGKKTVAVKIGIRTLDEVEIIAGITRQTGLINPQNH